MLTTSPFSSWAQPPQTSENAKMQKSLMRNNRSNFGRIFCVHAGPHHETKWNKNNGFSFCFCLFSHRCNWRSLSVLDCWANNKSNLCNIFIHLFWEVLHVSFFLRSNSRLIKNKNDRQNWSFQHTNVKILTINSQDVQNEQHFREYIVALKL